MLFDKIASVYFIGKIYFYFCNGNASPGNQHCANCISTLSFPEFGAKFEREVAYSRRYQNFLTTQCRRSRTKLPCQNQPDSFSRFDRTPTCDRHRHRATASTRASTASRAGNESVFSLVPQLSTSHCPHLLLSAVLRRRCCWASAPAIDRYLLPAGCSAANPLHATAALGQLDRQMDRHLTISPTLCHLLCRQCH